MGGGAWGERGRRPCAAFASGRGFLLHRFAKMAVQVNALAQQIVGRGQERSLFCGLTEV